MLPVVLLLLDVEPLKVAVNGAEQALTIVGLLVITTDGLIDTLIKLVLVIELSQPCPSL